MQDYSTVYINYDANSALNSFFCYKFQHYCCVLRWRLSLADITSMSASITITLQVSVSTRKHDRVAVTGSCKALGEWDSQRLKFMRLKPSTADKDLWATKIDIPFTNGGVEYRYLVCRKFSSADGDDAGDETYTVRHWEAGVHSRYKSINELGSTNSLIDTYGIFEPGSKMFVDQGWLINETEIQLRFYKDPIRIYKKRLKANSYNVKCSAVNLYHYETDYRSTSFDGREENFNQIIHGSNPLIRVTSLGKYKNREQSAHGMAVSETDYVIYKLRTFEWDSHGIKVDFYKEAEDPEGDPTFLGYANLLPFHLEGWSGSVSLAVNDCHGFPVGHVAVRYLVCKPAQSQSYDLRQSFSLYWNRSRPTLAIGHRGLGDTHVHDINSAKAEDVKHENTLSSFMKAGDSGADFVEFDVMLSKDMVPIIWHDFKVSILLRKKTKGHHQVHAIPVHELTLAQLQGLRVDFVKQKESDDEYCDASSTAESIPNAEMLPFPTLKAALDLVDDDVGFYVELKYPQYLHHGKVKDEGVESYYERNVFLDPILKVLHDHPKNRRIVLASFDADICIMARLKQNRYPVIMLIEDNGRTGTPYYHDIRAQRVATAVSLAGSERFLGLSVNAEAILRKNEELLKQIYSEDLICFVWGSSANDMVVREELKRKKVHAICYDEIGKNDTFTTSIYRAENLDEKPRSSENKYQSTQPGLKPDSNLTSQAEESSPSGSPSTGSSSVSSSGIPMLRVQPVPIVDPDSSSSDSSDQDSGLEKLAQMNPTDTKTLGHQRTLSSASNGSSYATDFY